MAHSRSHENRRINLDSEEATEDAYFLFERLSAGPVSSP